MKKNSKEILVDNKIIKVISLVYIVLPIIIFMFGFLRIRFAVLGTALLLVGAYFLFKNMQEVKYKIKLRYIIISFIISLIMCFIAGHGYNFSQTTDFNARNAVFRDLINNEWPVVFNNINSMLVYYIGQWMVPAFIGKIFNSWGVANQVLLFWNSIGITLALVWLSTLLKLKKQKHVILSNLSFLLFSGLDIVGVVFYSLSLSTHLEWWSPPFQFSSMTTQIFWVFNQVIVPWLVVLMLLNEKENGIKNYAALGLLTFPYGPFPLVGIIILLVPKGISYFIKWIKKKEIKNIFKELFSIQNVCMILSILPIYYLYYSSNGASSGSGGIRFMSDIGDFKVISSFIIFYILEAGLYLFFIRKYHKKDIIYYTVLISLIIIPFLQMGDAYDFCMRVSIPALVMIDFWVLEILFDKKSNIKVKNALVILLILGSITSFTEISRNINKYRFSKAKNDFLYDDWKTLSDKNPKSYSNFLGLDYMSSNFYKYIMKKR